MTIIYGLREVGFTEIRYVGRTDHPLEKRLHKHRLNVRQGYPDRICNWVASAQDIEIVPLAECPKDEACAVERRMVQALWEAGNRLTNGHLVPKDHICPARPLSPALAKERVCPPSDALHTFSVRSHAARITQVQA